MERFTTTGLHHVVLVVSDARRSLGFYRDVLGLRLVGRTVELGERPAHRLYLGDAAGRPGTLLALVEMAGARGRPGIGGMHHTALGVETEASLLKWKRRLSDLGWAVSGPYDRGYFTSIYFRDPDGQVLEIATAGPGYAIDEPADALGGELMLPQPRIVRGHRDEAAIAALTHPEAVPEITPDMALSGIHHVSGITDDLERADEFYRSALGLRLVKRTVNRDDPRQLHFFWASYREGQVAPHSSFTLFGWPSGWNRTREGVGQTQRVTFRADGADALAAWTEHLRTTGVEPGPVVDRGAFRSVAFRAPDGQPLALATDGPGFAVRGEVPLPSLWLPETLEPKRAEIEAALAPLE